MSCPICKDTGDMTGLGYLDCTACSSASERVALNAYVKSLGPMTQADLTWMVMQYARQKK